MKRIIWNVYEKFRCIAEKCPDSCCKGWEVDVDADSAQRYLAMEGSLGDRLRQVLKTEDGQSYMVLEHGRCPMWRQDGLCRIQAEKGHDALCRVCQEYPRLYMDFGDFAQWGLELSCPEAARLIFEGLSVRQEDVPGGESPEYDGEVMEILKKSREEVLNFWHSTQLTVPRALAVMLLYAHQVQSALDGGEYAALEAETCLADLTRFAGDGEIGLLISFFQELEILTDTWRNRLNQPESGNWDEKLRILAEYLIRRYWLQAVWDFDLVCRVKFMVSACILVNALGGNTLETAQLFSKEIENDPDNREAIFDGAYSHPALTDANLLGLLLYAKC